LEDSREHLEQAVVLAPGDVETWSALAELYALLLVDEPGLSKPLALAVDRCLALAPDSTSTLRAASMSSFVHGNLGTAADLADRCASSPASAGKPGSTSDLGCALVAAETQDMVSDLAILHNRFERNLRVGLPYARALVKSEQYREAVQVSEALREVFPKELGPLEILLDAHIALGQWEDVRKVGRAAVALAPDRVDLKVQVAEVLLKVDGAARPAFELYQQAAAHERFNTFAGRERALGDAASAAIAAGKYEDAIGFADAALAIAERNPIAGLHKARALQRLGKTQESEALLRATEPTSLSGHDLGAWHVAAAAFYITAGRERLAETELRSAAESDPFWPGVPITAARNRLAVGDRDGAINFLEQAAYMDLYMDVSRDPLQLVWLEPADWRTFRRSLIDDLLGDARYSSRGHGGIGVVAIYAGMTDARRVLERALVGGAPAPAANAALAQFHMHGGNTALALKHTSQVVETSSNPGILYGVRGRAMARNGRAAQARAAFVQALEKAPNEASLYRWRAEAQHENSDLRGARKSLTDALRLMPDDLFSRVLLVDLKRDSP
jgi:tetratricopeptide (TPR) repeat protein